MIDRLSTAFAPALLVATVCLLAACASQPERQNGQLRKAEPDQQAVEVEEPSPEELAKTPCGNPDWAQLPDGAEGKAADEARPADSQPAGGEPPQAPAPEGQEDEENGGERSDAADVGSNQRPCT